MKKLFFYTLFIFLSLSAAQGPLKNMFTKFFQATKGVKSNPYVKVQNKGAYIEELSDTNDEITLPGAIRKELKEKDMNMITPEILFGAVCRTYPKIDAITKQLVIADIPIICLHKSYSDKK
jgi:hypothetical protein